MGSGPALRAGTPGSGVGGGLRQRLEGDTSEGCPTNSHSWASSPRGRHLPSQGLGVNRLSKALHGPRGQGDGRAASCWVGAQGPVGASRGTWGPEMGLDRPAQSPARPAPGVPALLSETPPLKRWLGVEGLVAAARGKDLATDPFPRLPQNTGSQGKGLGVPASLAGPSLRGEPLGPRSMEEEAGGRGLLPPDPARQDPLTLLLRGLLHSTLRPRACPLMLLFLVPSVPLGAVPTTAVTSVGS